MYAHEDQDGISAVILRPVSNHSQAADREPDYEHTGEAARPVGGPGLPMLRWLAGQRRVTGMALPAASWAATLAAVIAGGGHASRGAAVQIIFAATISIYAMAETLLYPAVPVTIIDRSPPGTAGHHNRPGIVALVTGCVLGPLVGGATHGADWGTSLLASLAVACAVASIAAHRLGPLTGAGASRIRTRKHAAVVPGYGHRVSDQHFPTAI